MFSNHFSGLIKKINFLIGYTLEIINEDNLKLDAKDLINYTDNIPSRLSKNTRFMKYLVDIDYSNIKYLTYNELCPAKQRELIKEAIKEEISPIGFKTYVEVMIPRLSDENTVCFLAPSNYHIEVINRKYIDFSRSLSGFSKALYTAFSNDILIFAI